MRDCSAPYAYRHLGPLICEEVGGAEHWICAACDRSICAPTFAERFSGHIIALGCLAFWILAGLGGIGAVMQ